MPTMNTGISERFVARGNRARRSLVKKPIRWVVAAATESGLKGVGRSTFPCPKCWNACSKSPSSS